MSNSRTARQRQEEAIIRWLRLFLKPGQVTELRALRAPSWRIRHAFYDYDHLSDLAYQAAEWQREGAMGVYFIPNPLRPDILGSPDCACDEDVLRRLWVLIDIDSTRPDTKEPATDDEKKAAWDIAEKVNELLTPEGLVNPIVGDSGNGWHLCYPIDLPNDEASKLWHHSLLRWLKGECGKDKGVIDTSTANASRIWKLYGTKSQKGTPTAVRLHRWALVVKPKGD